MKGGSLSSLQAFLKRIKRRSAIILFFLLLALVYVLFDSHGLIQRIRLESDRSALEGKIRKLEQENASIEAEIEKLRTDDREIERIAREKYFMHRSDEKIIKVEPK
jgi:cell division protein DivIC